MKIRLIAGFTLFAGVVASPAESQARDSAAAVAVGAFVDTYYAWDFGRPPTLDRSFAGGASFTTQPARHNEFNVNLVFVEATLAAPAVRARLALQTGTSVDVNYAAETQLARHIQEAFAAVRIGRSVWVHGGIFFSHIGMESWISRNNLTYTRSLTAEYTPYYQSGAKLTWSPRPELTAQLNVVNGWQNIRENNEGKGAGVRIDWLPASGVTLSYYNLFSEEDGTRLRVLNGGGVKATLGRTTWIVQGDLGSQASSNSIGRAAHWYGGVLIGQMQASPRVAISGRVELFDDDEQIVIKTGAFNGAPLPPFRGFGGSIGVDVSPQPRLLWRTELREFENDGASFPDRGGMPSRKGVFVVTSIAVTL